MRNIGGARRSGRLRGRKNARRPVSRVLSAPSGTRRPFLWDAPRGTPHATNPNGRTETSLRPAPEGGQSSPFLFGLAPGGVYPAAPVARGAVRFYRTVSPVPAGGFPLARAVCFLWHCPWGRPRRTLSGTVFPWSPDFPPSPGCPGNSGRPAVWRGRHARGGRGGQGDGCGRSNGNRACNRVRVPMSAAPVTASGRQCRWKALSTVARAGSIGPSDAMS